MPLEFAFSTKKLRSMCEDEEVAISEISVAGADSLRQKLADLRAADSIVDLPSTTSLSQSDSLDYYTLQVSHLFSINIYPNHANVPMKNGHVDWSKVHRIRLEEA